MMGAGTPFTRVRAIMDSTVRPLKRSMLWLAAAYFVMSVVLGAAINPYFPRTYYGQTAPSWSDSITPGRIYCYGAAILMFHLSTFALYVGLRLPRKSVDTRIFATLACGLGLLTPAFPWALWTGRTLIDHWSMIGPGRD